MLQNTYAEQYLISATLHDPHKYIPEFRCSGIKLGHFTDDYSKRLWELVTESYDNGLTSEIIDLEERIAHSKELPDAANFAAGVFKIRSIFHGNEALGNELKRVQESYALRIFYEHSTRIHEDIEAMGIAGAQAALDRLTVDFNSATKGCIKFTLPTVTDLGALTQKHTTRPEPIIEGVIGAGDKLILSASSKAGKTWLMLQLAYAIQNGTTWLGHNCTKGNALYVNFELSEPWLAERVRLINRGGRFLDHPSVLNLRACEVSWDTLSKHIKNHIAETGKKYEIFILDPIYKMLGDSEENSNEDIARLLNELERMGHDNQAAIAFSHHHSKGNKSNVEAIERMSGAGVWGRDPDAIVDMVSHEDDDCYVVETVTRNYIKPPKVVVRCEFPDFVPVEDADPERLKKPGGSKATMSVADVAAICQTTPLGLERKTLVNNLTEAYPPASDKTAYRWISEAIKEGRIYQDTDSKLIKPRNATPEAELISQS